MLSLYSRRSLDSASGLHWIELGIINPIIFRTPSYRDGVERQVEPFTGDGGGPLDRQGKIVRYTQNQGHNWIIQNNWEALQYIELLKPSTRRAQHFLMVHKVTAMVWNLNVHHVEDGAQYADSYCEITM